MEVTIALLGILTLYLIRIFARWAYNRYKCHQILKSYGIPGPKPDFLDGNMSQLRAKPTPNDVISQWLKEYGNVVGYYMGGIPYIVINDVDMLKQIMLRDFHIFGNRPDMLLDVEPFNKTIIALRGERWKEVRACITPTFSSGKIKLMTSIVDKKVDITVKEISKKAENNETFDIYELVQRLTLDVIADCALAMKTHCQENSKDEFYFAVRDFFRFSHNKTLDYAIMFPFVTSVMAFLSKYMTAGKMTSLIVKNVASAIKSRQKNPHFKSMDILQLMLDHSKNDENGNGGFGMSDKDIIANSYIFLLAGYETTATALAFTFYLLITHPEIQERLQEEIDAVEDSSYATIQSLQYLDQVFNESLRLYPPVTGFVSRTCDVDYPIGKFTIPKGAQVVAPVWDLHHDPDLWRDPWEFDPERFSPENKGSINSMAFIPFGVGRRNCIGARFAQLEAKLAIYRLLKKFKFEVCEKTDNPIKLVCPTVIINPENGVWVRAVPRDSTKLT